jgi:light-regulated signal transduction histidine kinase (bacteriophytochrome)
LSESREEQLEASQLRLEQLNRELTRSNEELERFAYVASHDLSEPLRAISAFTKRLGDRYKGELDETADEWIYYITDGCERMRTLIQALLAYSRVGRTPVIIEEVDTGQVVDGVLRSLQEAIEDHGAEVTRDDDLPTVRADRNQLPQVLQNLIANSLKFTDGDKPRVHVGAERGASEWTFSVKDNGIGMDPKYADRIFEPFERLHTREQFEGAGIGLAVCRRVIERHHGEIWVESEPGAGTTFFFTIPD